MNPFVSIVMSAHDEERYIRDAIVSMLRQTYRDFEFIIINDGSTDRSGEIIREFDDERITLIQHETVLGLTKCLNEGLRAARGELIARMDANDVSAPTRLEKQVRVFESRPDVDLVWTGSVYITRMGEYLCPKLAPSQEETVNLLRSCPTDSPVGRNHVNHVTVMYRKRSVLKVGGYSEAFRWGQDGNLWCRMLKSGARFHLLDEPLVSIRLLPDSVSATRNGERQRDENEYYVGICRLNGEHRKALQYVLRMPWSPKKVRLLLGSLKHRLVSS
jgi:glycosyltransferase involved in cell wall biosynthesis